jgi:uncharacterized protein (TIGR00375 family)
MNYIADLHVHSKYSRATAKNLDLENLYIAAQLKGITVVGTGDFTYPQWFEEIQQKLVPAEQGLFRLKDELANECDQHVPRSCRGTVRFILATEISNIYKKNDKTRKNHNLVLVPDMDIAERFSVKLDNIGNIKSDGRPILGLDARDLLETLLDTSDQAILIPAHIWTPWFSMLGSKSGFDSVEECFEDLTPHIFAVETGLSSDPPMNWRVSALDGLTLVSNSDAHSPLNLGREANLFNTELSYAAMRAALYSGDPGQFLGTFEFYPEEGKYHLDGHRKCKVCLWPEKTIRHEGLCPQCGKPLTLGVLYRVEELADRPHGNKPEKHHPYHSIIPLVDILSEIFRVGPKSKKVSQAFFSALDKLGSELNILHYLEPGEIDAAGIPLLGEAVGRMRQKKIEVNPGYDGEYGKVKIFTEDERLKFLGQQALFAVDAGVALEEKKTYQKPAISKKITAPDPADRQKAAQPNLPKTGKTGNILGQLNNNQRRAVEHPCGPLMIVAGPGTGKTRTLTHRIAYLIRQRNVSPRNILAVTFTNKAAEEMHVRLQDLFGDDRQMPFVATFHGLCLNVLNELNQPNINIIADDDDRKKLISEAIKLVANQGSRVAQKPQAVLKQIVDAKQHIMDPEDVLNASVDHLKSENQLFAKIYRTYQDLLAIQGLNDYEDLIFKVVRRFESDPKVCRVYQDRFKHIFVDEYQDLNQGQYRIIRALAPDQRSTPDICVIGDPDQSIYGFRGSDTKYFNRFVHDYPKAGVIRLTRNYRSTEAILGASFQVISAHHEQSPDSRTYSQIDGIKTISILELAHEKAEAEAIARTIENLVGGTGFHSIDTGKIDDANISGASSYSDFAVLYRTHAQHRVIADVFDNAGIPFQIASRENVLSQPGLPELISYLKVVEGFAAYGDHESVMYAIMPGIWKKSRDAFKNWCYQNRFSLHQGLSNAKRFPVPGLSTANQQTLNYFSNHFEELATILAEMKVAEKLIYLVKNTKLSATFESDAGSADALENLVETAERFDYRMAEFISALALHTDTDVYASRVEKVSLMTMHAAKGLEFPIVFISGCEQGYIPFERSNREPQDIEEERRLFYVAMTRAMNRLYFTRAKSRRIYGRLASRPPSPFVTDIEAHLKKDESPRKTKKKKKSDQKQLSLF